MCAINVLRGSIPSSPESRLKFRAGTPTIVGGGVRAFVRFTNSYEFVEDARPADYVLLLFCESLRDRGSRVVMPRPHVKVQRHRDFELVASGHARTLAMRTCAAGIGATGGARGLWPTLEEHLVLIAGRNNR